MTEHTTNKNKNEPNKKPVCHYCNHENELGYSFCSYCGSNLFYRLCPRCYSRVGFEIKVCGNCGLGLSSSYQIPPRQNNLIYPNQQQISPVSYAYDNFYQQPRSKWWNLPAFYLTYSIFGLIIVSNLAGGFFLFLFFNTQNLPNFLLINLENIFIKIFQLLFILIALKVFKGFHYFFVKNNDRINQTVINTTPFGPINKLVKKKNFISMILFILLLMSIILIIEQYSEIIITFFRNFLNLGPSISAYTIEKNNISQYLFLICFVDIIFGPIAEEILFRGLLQQALDRSETSDFSHYIIQGTIFALAHLWGDIINGGSIDFIAIHMIFAFSLAVSATFLRKKFNSLIPSILLHSLINSFGVFSYFLNTNYFTPNQLFIINLIFYLVPLGIIVTIIMLAYLIKDWRIKFPLIFKQDKNNSFTSKIILIAFLSNISQYLFLILPVGSAIIYFIVIIFLSPALFIYWGSEIHDITWKQVKSQPNKEKNPLNK